MVGKKKKSTKKKKSSKKISQRGKQRKQLSRFLINHSSHQVIDHDSDESRQPLDQEGPIGDENASITTGRKKSGKKKSTKKGKLTTAEKLLIKLEKGAELLKLNRPNFEHFVQTADAWLIQHGKKLKEKFLRKEENADGVITYDEMKSALYDMECTMSMVEIHLLCKLLDNENSGDIDYTQLNEGLRHYMKLGVELDEEEYSDATDDENSGKSFALIRGQSARDIKHCQCCNVGLWLPPDKDIEYAEVTMMLITFADTLKKHPCHFTKVVHTHLTVYGLIQLIKSEVGIQSSTISVFRDKSRSMESELSHELTLAECGYEGREWHNPMEHVIYYDYTSEFNSCPILMCDHYFTDKLNLS